MKISIGSINIYTTPEQDAGLLAASNAANAACPRDDKGAPVGEEHTVESYLAARLTEVLDSYAHQAKLTEAEVIKAVFLTGSKSVRDAISAAANPK